MSQRPARPPSAVARVPCCRAGDTSSRGSRPVVRCATSQRRLR